MPSSAPPARRLRTSRKLCRTLLRTESCPSGTWRFRKIVIVRGMRFRTLLAVACALGLQNAMGAGDGPYRFLNEIPIGGEGGWDILTIDQVARRLYLSHATKVVIVDIDANKVVGEIGDMAGVHAFVAVPEVQRGFSSNGKED